VILSVHSRSEDEASFNLRLEMNHGRRVNPEDFPERFACPPLDLRRASTFGSDQFDGRAARALPRS